MKYIINSLLLIFTYSFSGAQVQIGNDLDGLQPDGNFGKTVSISSDGTKLAVLADDYIRAYALVNGSWVSISTGLDFFTDNKTLVLSGDGNRLAITRGDWTLGIAGGRTRVYEYDGESWIQMGEDLTGTSWSQYGTAVDFSEDGSRLIVSAVFGGPSYAVGQIYTYSYQNNQWLFEQSISGNTSSQTGDFFGLAISLSADGNRLAVGAPGFTPNIGYSNNLGEVTIYEDQGISAVNWVQMGNTLVGQLPGTMLGTALALSGNGNRLVIPVHGIAGAPEQIETYEFDNENWIVIDTSLTLEGISALNIQVDLAYHGNRLAIGAGTLNSSLIYEFVSGSWVSWELPIPGEATGDAFGTTISLNSDGNFIAVGAPGNEGAGQARVYYTNTPDLSDTVCESYVSPSGNYTWTYSGIFLDTIPDGAGGDSSIVIHLTIDNSSATMNFITCESYTSPSGNHTWNTSGIYHDTIPNSAGCDSLLTIDLSIQAIDSSVSKTQTAFHTNQTGATYQWLDCNNNYTPIPGATNQSFTPVINGYYAVEITQGDCSLISDCQTLAKVNIVPTEVEIFALTCNGTGNHVAISDTGNRFAIGTSINSGTIKIYDYNSGDYFQIGNTITQETPNDGTGSVFAISGDGYRVAVGRSNGNVSIYEQDGSSWIVIGNPIILPSSINVVAMTKDGKRVGISSGGVIGMYQYDETNWVQVGQGIVENQPIYALGRHIALSENGNRIAVSANQQIGAIGVPSSIFLTYELQDSIWGQVGNTIVKGDWSEPDAPSTVSLSADGNRLAVGATPSWRAGIYEFDGFNWNELGQELNFNGSYLGQSITMSADGNRVLIGVPGYQPPFAGSAHLLEYNNGDWIEAGCTITGENNWDGLGTGIAMSRKGNRMIVGTPGCYFQDGFVGSVRIYSIDDMVSVIEACDSYTSPNSNTTWTVSGIYEDAYIDESGCEITETINLTIQNCNNISQENTNKTKLYPNPTDGKASVHFSQVYERAKIYVYNILAQLVAVKDVEKTNEAVFKIPGPPGCYFVNISVNGKLHDSFKIIKK